MKSNLELARAAMQSHITRRNRRYVAAAIVGTVAAAILGSAITDRPNQRDAQRHSTLIASEVKRPALLAQEIGQYAITP